jgi:hypothetical protein
MCVHTHMHVRAHTHTCTPFKLTTQNENIQTQKVLKCTEYIYEKFPYFIQFTHKDPKLSVCESLP